jgi:hypothetical protein
MMSSQHLAACLPRTCLLLQVKFPTPRRALLSSSSGTLVFPNKPRSKVQVWYGQPGIRNW